jgi:hypothetical protein
MTSNESLEARQIYAAARQRDPEDRAAYLDRACAGKPDLHAHVVALLQASTEGFGHAPVAQPPRSATLDPVNDIDGRVIGPYIIRRELGRGGMGIVYLADDTRLARRVALKALAPGLDQATGGRERLRLEARAAAGLSHPGIATVYALEEIGNELYLACEYVPGEALRVTLKTGPLPIPQVITIAAQLARALAAAHTLGIIHRDIKPENVMKTPSGAVKVLDFGLARIADAPRPTLTQTGMVMGTPAYMAPEQALGRNVDFRTDLFAFGLLVYELAAGINPFIAKTIDATLARIVQEEPPLLSAVRSDSVPELDRIVATCLRKDPMDRYSSTQEVVADLDRLEAGFSSLRPQPAWPGLDDSRAKPLPRRTTAWWWKFHQLITAAIYIAMIYPVWRAQRWLPAPWGMLFLFTVLASVAAATTLRLHVWFVAGNAPEELKEQERRTRPWTRGCDAAFAAAQFFSAVGIFGEHPEYAMLFVSMATATVVASLVIEPSAVRAMFKTASTGVPAWPGSSRV